MSLADLNAAVAVSVAALDALAKQSETTASTVTTSNAKAGDSFTDLLAKISGYGVFGGVGGVANLHPEIDPKTGQPTGKTLGDEIGGPITIGDLLKQLATVIEGEKEFQRSGGAGFNIRTNMAAFEDSIQKITQLIHTWGGAEGTAFDLETFRRWLDDQQKAAAGGGAAQAPAGSGTGPGASSPSATKPPSLTLGVSGGGQILSPEQALWAAQMAADAAKANGDLKHSTDVLADAAKLASGDLKHSTDVLATSSADLGVQIKFLMLMFNQGAVGIGKAADDAAKKIAAATTTAGNIGAMGSRGLLP